MMLSMMLIFMFLKMMLDYSMVMLSMMLDFHDFAHALLVFDEFETPPPQKGTLSHHKPCIFRNYNAPPKTKMKMEGQHFLIGDAS